MFDASYKNIFKAILFNKTIILIKINLNISLLAIFTVLYCHKLYLKQRSQFSGSIIMLRIQKLDSFSDNNNL